MCFSSPTSSIPRPLKPYQQPKEVCHRTLAVCCVAIAALSFSLMALFFSGHLEKWLSPTSYMKIKRATPIYLGALAVGGLGFLVASIYHCAAVIEQQKKKKQPPDFDQLLEKRTHAFQNYLKRGSRSDLKQAGLSSKDVQRLRGSFKQQAGVVGGALRLLADTDEVTIIAFLIPKLEEDNEEQVRLALQEAVQFTKNNFAHLIRFVVSAHPDMKPEKHLSMCTLWQEQLQGKELIYSAPLGWNSQQELPEGVCLDAKKEPHMSAFCFESGAREKGKTGVFMSLSEDFNQGSCLEAHTTWGLFRELFLAGRS